MLDILSMNFAQVVNTKFLRKNIKQIFLLHASINLKFLHAPRKQEFRKSNKFKSIRFLDILLGHEKITQIDKFIDMSLFIDHHKSKFHYEQIEKDRKWAKNSRRFRNKENQ